MWIIYRHIAPNGKSYIGQTLQSPDDRWKDGFGYLKTRTKFAKAIIDFGWSTFKHEILETDIPTIEIANEREIYWIEYYNSYYNGYNSTLGGSGLKDGKHIYKIDMLDLSVICEYSSIAAAGREYGTAKEKCISDCCERKMHSSCGFYWCYTEDFNENWTPIEKSKFSSGNERPVCQISPDNLEIIHTFNSCAEASKALGITTINAAAIGSQNKAGGFYWCYVEDYPTWTPPVRKSTGNRRKVGQFDKDNNLIAEFESAAAAARAIGGDPSGIGKVCRGQKTMAYGYIWKFI